MYTRLKSPAQEPGEFRHVFHTRPNARLKEGGLRRSKHKFHFRASARLVNLRVAGGPGVTSKSPRCFSTPGRMSSLVRMPANATCRSFSRPSSLVAHLDQDILLHPDVGLVGLEIPLHFVHKGLPPSFRTSAKAHAAGNTADATLEQADGLFIDKSHNRIEHDALLVVKLHKAPHGVTGGVRRAEPCAQGRNLRNRAPRRRTSSFRCTIRNMPSSPGT